MSRRVIGSVPGIGTRLTLLAVTAGALVLGATDLVAQVEPSPHRAQPERPSVATHAGTVAPGWLEIEAGVERDRLGPGDASLATPALVKLGVAPRIQLDVMLTTVRPSSTQSSGVGDATLAMKWRLLEGAPFVGDFALQPAVTLPTGSATRGTGSGTTDASLLAISSHVLGPVALDVNLGYTRRSGGGPSADAMVWALSTGTAVTRSWGVVAELFGYPGFGGPASVGFLAGPTWAVRPWIVLDAGFVAHLAGDQPRALYGGLTWNVGRAW